MDSALVLLGAGSNGIDELRDFLDDTDSAVQWAIVQFDLGTGTLCRKKCIFVHINGASCPAVARGKAIEYTAVAQSILRSEGKFHASLEVEHKTEVTVENLVNRASRAFVADAGEYSVTWRRQQHEQHIQKASQKSAQLISVETEDPASRTIPGHESKALFTVGRDALRAVGDPSGPWNWILFGADPGLLLLKGGGDGSVNEMRECAALHQSEVLYGVLRLDFGVGRLRRVKHVFVHIVGAAAGVVTRGHALAMRPRMEAAVSECLCFSLAFEAACPEDLTLEALIERVQQVVGAHDVTLGADDSSKSVFTVEAFRAALEEKRCCTVSTKSTKHAHDKSQFADKTVEEIVKLVHATDTPLNWALFGPKEIPLSRFNSLPILHMPNGSPAIPTQFPSGYSCPYSQISSKLDKRNDFVLETPPSICNQDLQAEVVMTASNPTGWTDGNSKSGEMGRESGTKCDSNLDAAEYTHNVSLEVEVISAMAGMNCIHDPAETRTGQTHDHLLEGATANSIMSIIAVHSPRFSGHLLKMSHLRNTWQPRYCEIVDGEFCWWHSEQAAAAGQHPRQRISLQGLHVTEQSDQILCFQTALSNRIYKFKKACNNNMADWARALEEEAVLPLEIWTDLNENAFFNTDGGKRRRVIGEGDYKFGNITKAYVKEFTGKDHYRFGDISRTIAKKLMIPCQQR